MAARGADLPGAGTLSGCPSRLESPYPASHICSKVGMLDVTSEGSLHAPGSDPYPAAASLEQGSQQQCLTASSLSQSMSCLQNPCHSQ